MPDQLFKTIVIIFICIVLQTSVIFAEPNFYVGKLKVSETDYSGKKAKDYHYQLKYYQNKNYFRLDTPKTIYYLIEIATEKAFVINKKRKCITQTNLSGITGFPIPPVSIINSKTAMLQYLSKVKAKKNLSAEKNNTKNLEAWQFSLDKNTEYNVVFAVPEYQITKISINAEKTTLQIEVIPEKLTGSSQHKDTLLNLPKGFKVVDLTAD